MRKLVVASLLAIMIVAALLGGMYLVETGKCKIAERDYPELSWRVMLFKCFGLQNGRWITYDSYVLLGRD